MSDDNQLIKGLQTTLGRMEIALGAVHEAILWTAEDGTIIWCNKSFDRLVSRPHISILGDNVFDIFPLEDENGPLIFGYHPCQKLQQASLLSTSLYTFKRKEEAISLEISGNSTELDSSDKILILTIRDITTLRFNQKELEKAKETLELKVLERTEELLNISKRYQAILAQAVDGIITIDTQGIINSFNPAAEKIFGYPAAEIIGKSVNILMPSPHRENHDQYMRDYLRSGTKKIIGIGREVIGVHRDGRRIHLDLAVSESVSKSQRLFTGIIRDISARREAEAALEEAKSAAEKANRIKSGFLARISHEIRTPMNAILGMAELLHDTRLTSEQKNYIQIFENAGKHLLSIINDLLDLEKIDAGKFRLETISLDLHTLFSETYDIMAIEAQKKGLKLTYSISPEVPLEVVGDPLRLQQILINLVGNAIKFTEHGEVSFGARKGAVAMNERRSSKKVELQFEVRDTGVGIAEAEQETIFESFTQAEQSSPRKAGGTGLGLPISRKLVRQMGGELAVSSALPNGSVFTFNAWFLQVERSEVDICTKEVPINSNPDIPIIAGPIRILLVDDSADNRFLFETFLKQLDCKLDCADNGMAGFERFRETEYDLVLMDIQMPVLDGYSATRMIRSHEKENNLSRTPVVAISAHARTEEKEKSLQAGCNMHISKPVNKNTLLTAISSLLSKDNHFDTNSRDTNASNVIVHIDKILEDLIPDFLQNRRDDINDIREAVPKGDMELVERLGHMMKGAGGGYGFQKITELGDAFERAAHQKDESGILRLTKELEIYLDTLEVVFVD